MKLWLSVLLVLAVVSGLGAGRGGKRREWRRPKFAELQTTRHGDSIMATDNETKEDDDDSVRKSNWMSRKERKWNGKRQRTMKGMKKRRGMMTADDLDNYRNNEVQNSYEDNYSVTHRRRWNADKRNKARKSQKWRKMKKLKRLHKRPSCFCLQAEQLEKLWELIKKEGLESTFTQIMPPAEENIPDTSDVSDDKDDDLIEDIEKFDNTDEDQTK